MLVAAGEIVQYGGCLHAIAAAADGKLFDLECALVKWQSFSKLTLVDAKEGQVADGRAGVGVVRPERSLGNGESAMIQRATRRSGRVSDRDPPDRRGLRPRSGEKGRAPARTHGRLLTLTLKLTCIATFFQGFAKDPSSSPIVE